jgi:hypothetical protein
MVGHMHNNDLELKLTKGSPIKIENVGTLYPLTLGEISDIGEMEYNKMIYSFSLKKEMFNIENEISQFELTLLYCRQDEDFRNLFLESVFVFTKETLNIFDENNTCFFYFGSLEEERFVGIKEFDEIVQIIKRQNFINDKEKEEEFNPTSEKAKELIDKLKYFRQRVKEKNQEKGLDLSDIISIVAAHSGNINIFNVWDLTVFQLYSLYIRLMMKENFGLEYAKYIQGEDPKNLKLDHWASKLTK